MTEVIKTYRRDLIDIFKSQAAIRHMEIDEARKWLEFIFAKEEAPKVEDVWKGEDFVICRECGQKLKAVTASHVKLHGMTFYQYLQKYGITWKDCYTDYHIEKINPINRKNR